MKRGVLSGSVVGATLIAHIDSGINPYHETFRDLGPLANRGSEINRSLRKGVARRRRMNRIAAVALLAALMWLLLLTMQVAKAGKLGSTSTSRWNPTLSSQ